MRLADRIAAAARDRRNPLQPDFARLASAIGAAERFEISPEAGAMAAAIGKSDARRLRQARAFARTPFRSVFVEHAGTSGEFYGHDLEPVRRGQLRPHRSAMLIETDESFQRGTITQIWCATLPAGGPALEVSPLCATFDWREVPAPVPSLARAPANEPFFPNGPQTARERRLAEQISVLTAEELEDDSRRHGYVSNPRAKACEDILDDLARRDPAGAPDRFRAILDNWSGELNFVYAFLICLNSRNLLRVEPGEDLGRLNKARRRLGRPELLPFASVKLSLSQVMRRKEMAAAGAGDMRAHLVRGHFKLRKTGAFWWSPFVRGDARKGLAARRGYEVAP